MTGVIVGGMLVGYARVSTTEQSSDHQTDACCGLVYPGATGRSSAPYVQPLLHFSLWYQSE